MSESLKITTVARQFAHSDDTRAWIELGVTFSAYVVGMGVALMSIGHVWLMVPAILVAAAMGLRLYMILHDCMHGSFFSRRRMNDLVGTLLSPIAMTPYRATQHIHNLHHTHVSDLDRRDTFEFFTMTRREWDQASPARRLQYRLYRSPVTLILLGPFIFYTVVRRLPLYGFKTGVWDLVLHNLLLAGYLTVIWVGFGWPGLCVWAAVVYVACACGALIPYVVHNFETIHWGTKPELDFQKAALEGSAVLDWGRGFDVLTLNIGYHDLHHLNARIPGYRLRAAHQALEDQGLIQSSKVTFLEGLGCLRWKLYDEAADRMIPFPPRTQETVRA